MIQSTFKQTITFVLLLFTMSAHAGDVVTDINIGMELARDIADETIKACRHDGYHISAVVVDRSGTIRAALRDDLASRFTLDIAERKANMTVMAWMDSGAFKNAREDIRQELNHIPGLIVMQGGLKIVSGGNNIGAVGVSGAPGGDKDAACARTALKKLAERIAFAFDE
ncbi:MAG: heme-binding protein [Gammaproteobacteria bacterium]|nr:heme-binding protein [Gammaproteobacteria bacterium]